MPDASSLASTLVNLGLSPLGAAALASRAGVESSYNPTAMGDNNTSYGLWQMHGPRMAALMNYAKTNGLDPADPTTQAKYVVQELGGSEKSAGNMLRAATTPEQAAAAVMAYERPAGYSAANPMGGLGSAKTLAGTRALLAGGVAPSAAQGQPGSAAPTASPPTDPDPLQQVAAISQPAQPALQPQPTQNLGLSTLGASDPGQQAQQAASLLAQFMAQQGGDPGALVAPMSRIPSILGRRPA